MRLSLPALLLLAPTAVNAQQVDWLASWPMDYTMNPAMPDQVLASAPGRLVGMRMVNMSLIYGQEVYGDVALDAVDPLTGTPLLSCLLLDSVAVDAAAVDTNGVAYFSGRFVGDVLEVCDGSQLPGESGFLLENYFLLAWDLTNGSPLWMRNINVDHPNVIEVPSLAIDPNGDLWYLLTEFTSGTAIRVDDNGDDVEWRAIDGTRRFGTLSFDPWGGLYVSGSCENGTLTFGGQSFPVSSAGGYNMFVLRFKPDGDAGFAQFASDVTFQNPTVAAVADGHAYLAGDLFDSTSWGGLTFHGPNWVYDVFLAQLDSTGQFLWGAESAPPGGPITGDMYRAKGPCVAVDAGDMPYLMGTLRGSVDWGNGVVSDGLTLGVQTLTIVSFAPDGTAHWAATSQPAGATHQAQTLTVLAENDALHFAGHIWSDFVFPPESTNIGGGQAAMVGRMGGLSTALPDGIAASVISYWPNPAGDVLHVELEGAHTVDLLNSVGQCVKSYALLPGINSLNVSNLVPGLYLMRMGDENPVRIMKE